MSILPQLLINSLIAASIYALVALGFNLIYGTVKFFNLAHGVLAVLGGYAVFFLSKFLGLNLFLSIGLGVALAGSSGFLLDKIIYLPLRRRRASSLVLLVASLGAFSALQALLAIIFSSQFQTLSDLATGRTYEIFGGVVTEVQLSIFFSGLFIMIILAALLKRTRFGKAVKAVSDDEEVARVVGINTDKIIGRVFFIGSAITGLAGILVGLDTGFEPTMGMGLLLKGAVASIIGGLGNLYGAILGALFLGFAENFGIWKIPGEWKEAIAFGLLIVFLLFRPRGIIQK